MCDNTADSSLFFFFADKPNSYFTQTPPTPRDGKYIPASCSLVPMKANCWSLPDPVIYFVIYLCSEQSSSLLTLPGDAFIPG